MSYDADLFLHYNFLSFSSLLSIHPSFLLSHITLLKYQISLILGLFIIIIIINQAYYQHFTFKAYSPQSVIRQNINQSSELLREIDKVNFLFLSLTDSYVTVVHTLIHSLLSYHIIFMFPHNISSLLSSPLSLSYSLLFI